MNNFDSTSSPLSQVLNLDLGRINGNDEIDSIPYYHGRMDRQQAECLLYQNGQFLMRTSGIDQQSVISCRHDSQFLHFIIHETETKPKRFYFENEMFSTVQRLVDYHWRNGLPVTLASGAILLTPVAAEPANRKCFPNEYLRQVHSGMSSIKLERQEFIPGLDLDVRDILLRTNASALAQHLFRRNVKFLGFDHPGQDEPPPEGWLITSGLELMLLPHGTQLRKDLIVRHECLKYFVIATVLRAPGTETKFQLLKKWIEIADHLEREFRDHFGFASIMCGLSFPKIHDSNLWRDFSCKHLELAKMFETRLRAKLATFLNPGNPEESNNATTKTTLPFLIQLCHIIECRNIVDFALQLPSSESDHKNFDQTSFINEIETYDHKVGLNNFTMDDVIQLIIIENQIIDQLDHFEQNVKHLLFTDGNYSYPNETKIEQLFMTNFHVDYLKSDEDDDEPSSSSHLWNYQDFHRLELKWNNW